MARRPQDAVQFTYESAERIADVVRAAELATPQSRPLTFEARLDQKAPKIFRVCTFSGSWAIGSSKTVTFKNQTATPNTAMVENLFWPLPTGGTRDCAIAKDGTAWYLMVPRMYPANAATAAEITTASITFKTLPVAAFATAGTATFTLSITTCATATT